MLKCKIYNLSKRTNINLKFLEKFVKLLKLILTFGFITSETDRESEVYIEREKEKERERERERENEIVRDFYTFYLFIYFTYIKMNNFNLNYNGIFHANAIFQVIV